MNSLRSLAATFMLMGAMPTRAQHENPGFSATPLTDMGQEEYKGFKGGLYENGSNAAPPDHAARGLKAAAAVRPLDADGKPDPNGKIVLVSIGMSNTTMEFCGGRKRWDPSVECFPGSFMSRAGADARVNHASLVIVNGARGGQVTSTWNYPTLPNYDRLRDLELEPAHVTERQVQVVWLKEADPRPSASLPSESADAYALEAGLGRVVRALKARYPNLRQVFLSSRIYAGYANTSLNPEPYAYETGFSVKWLIQAQIDQARSGEVKDARAGDLGPGAAPWIGWGPYLWADGTSPRSDRLTWSRSDLGRDGTHPSPWGASKVASLLEDFFLSSPFTGWFRASPASGS